MPGNCPLPSALNGFAFRRCATHGTGSVPKAVGLSGPYRVPVAVLWATPLTGSGGGTESIIET